MKQRLLVMNGQCLVQVERDGQWATEKVEKAGSIKPGIYNIYLAADADKAKAHEGIILYVEPSRVYQQVGKSFVKYAVADFDKVPDTGTNVSIRFVADAAQATLITSSRRLKHGIS